MKTTLFILTLFPFIGWGQKQITWADFKAPIRVGVSDDIAAETYTRLSFITLGKPGDYVFGIVPLFIPDSSWTRVYDDATLEHERTHYAITRIVALWAVKGIKPLQHSNYRDEAIKWYNKFADLWEKMETDFDKETDNGRNKSKEIEWELRIYKQLADLNSD